MLSAFSIDKTLNRKGKFPLDASNASMTRLPMSSGRSARCSERIVFVVKTWDGDLGWVPIQSWTISGKERKKSRDALRHKERNR